MTYREMIACKPTCKVMSKSASLHRGEEGEKTSVTTLDKVWPACKGTVRLNECDRKQALQGGQQGLIHIAS